MSDNLLELNGLKKYFFQGNGQVTKAVDGVDLCIKRGETVGLVGESGCGKTTLGRTIMRLYKPTAGRVIFSGTDIFTVRGNDSLRLCRDIQMVFQDPYASLNPRMTVEDIVGESFDIHNLVKGKERNKKIHNLFSMVGLDPRDGSRFPYEFSGGQRQRIGIARALAADPSFIVLDEPISALDVSIQAQIINLLSKLQKEHNLTYLFISHDLAMVKYISARIAVMYMGNIIEIAESGELYTNAEHPYTKALLSSIPIPDPGLEKNRKPIILKEAGVDHTYETVGCLFVSRCPYVQEICKKEKPTLKNTGDNHLTACHLI